MTDLEKARTVPCPGCKMPADSGCVDVNTGVEVDGVHSARIYRAYVVAEAVAHNRAVELEAEVEQLRATWQHAKAQLQEVHDQINPVFDKRREQHALVHDIAARLGITLWEEHS